MKPRLRKHRGLWLCGIPVPPFGLRTPGVGYTAKQAYDEWSSWQRHYDKRGEQLKDIFFRSTAAN